METILSKLLEQNMKIERDISRIGSFDDGEICSSIIIKLRTFVEHIAAYHYINQKGLADVVTQENITAGIPFVKRDKKLKFINDIHNCLQACASHYVVDEVTSPRLIQKYMPYLLKIKRWIKEKYNVDLLSNLGDLAKLYENQFVDYYKPIKDKMVGIMYTYNPHPLDRYYVNSCHPIIVDDEIIYEVTLGLASDFASKFNRFIVFSKEEIPTNYSIRCEIVEKKINLTKYTTSIKIVQDWCISIRPCEIMNFGKLLGVDEKVSASSPEYNKLMSYLMNKRMTLLDLVSLSEVAYKKVKEEILSSTKEIHIFNILDSSRLFVNSYYNEKNLIKYLSYNLNNKIIKSQLSYKENNIGLFINKGVYPFCSMPFAMSLVEHNPSLIDLIEIFGTPKENELVYRKIRNKIESENIIYHKLDELFKEDIDYIKKQIDLINNRLSWKPSIQIDRVGEYYYLKNAENSTTAIIDKLLLLSTEGIIGYTDFVESKIKEYNINIDSEEKRKIVYNLFSNTKVACIYGPAGTGKSYLARIISEIYKDSKKLYLANTNTAVNNIYRKVGGNISDFLTIRKYLNGYFDCDVLFIDECSMVSNDDMLEILSRSQFKCLVLMGDIVQIESIKFGNWYKLAKVFLEKKVRNELSEMHRTTSASLKLLWSKLRNKENVVDEILSQYGMEKELTDESLFEHRQYEIVLSLNYNGLYGINNLNNIMQENNPGKQVKIWSYTYKENDPIIFTDNNQYAPVLYNNLKGNILSLENSMDKITFILSVETILNEMSLSDYSGIKLIDIKGGKSIISLEVEKKFDSDKDEDKSKLVPFQIAYAISIHKSQGLEFENVKIVISSDVDNEITHNIFYTAVTRSTKNLTIYWSTDTQTKIMKKVLEIKNYRDVGIISSKGKYKIRDKNLSI